MLLKEERNLGTGIDSSLALTLLFFKIKKNNKKESTTCFGRVDWVYNLVL